jgi:hypothetical protein
LEPRLDGGSTNAAPASECDVVHRHDEHFPQAAQVDVKAWRTAHHVNRGFAESACWDAADRVGVPNAPGLFCETAYRSPPRTESRLYRLEGEKLRVVWQRLVATWTNWTEITPLLAEDGVTLRLVERTPRDCANAYEQSKEKLESQAQPYWLHEELLQACHALGTYAWNGKQYTRTDAPTLESSCATPASDEAESSR